MIWVACVVLFFGALVGCEKTIREPGEPRVAASLPH